MPNSYKVSRRYVFLRFRLACPLLLSGWGHSTFWLTPRSKNIYVLGWVILVVVRFLVCVAKSLVIIVIRTFFVHHLSTCRVFLVPVANLFSFQSSRSDFKCVYSAFLRRRLFKHVRWLGSFPYNLHVLFRGFHSILTFIWRISATASSIYINGILYLPAEWILSITKSILASHLYMISFASSMVFVDLISIASENMEFVRSCVCILTQLHLIWSQILKRYPMCVSDTFLWLTTSYLLVWRTHLEYYSQLHRLCLLPGLYNPSLHFTVPLSFSLFLVFFSRRMSFS